VLHLHELLTYLGGHGVTTILIMAQHGLVAPSTESPVDASYLSDTVVLLRFFEARGQVCIAISVMKKRTGEHERTIRSCASSAAPSSSRADHGIRRCVDRQSAARGTIRRRTPK